MSKEVQKQSLWNQSGGWGKQYMVERICGIGTFLACSGVKKWWNCDDEDYELAQAKWADSKSALGWWKGWWKGWWSQNNLQAEI